MAAAARSAGTVRRRGAGARRRGPVLTALLEPRLAAWCEKLPLAAARCSRPDKAAAGSAALCGGPAVGAAAWPSGGGAAAQCRWPLWHWQSPVAAAVLRNVASSGWSCGPARHWHSMARCGLVIAPTQRLAGWVVHSLYARVAARPCVAAHGPPSKIDFVADSNQTIPNQFPSRRDSSPGPRWARVGPAYMIAYRASRDLHVQYYDICKRIGQYFHAHSRAKTSAICRHVPRASHLSQNIVKLAQ